MKQNCCFQAMDWLKSQLALFGVSIWKAPKMCSNAQRVLTRWFTGSECSLVFYRDKFASENTHYILFDFVVLGIKLWASRILPLSYTLRTPRTHMGWLRSRPRPSDSFWSLGNHTYTSHTHKQNTNRSTRILENAKGLFVINSWEWETTLTHHFSFLPFCRNPDSL